MLISCMGVGRIIAADFLNPGRKVRAPWGRALGNPQRKRFRESATENKPPAVVQTTTGKGETVG